MDLPGLPKRRPESHKGDCGRVLIVAGSPGMTGAACLTAMGALRGGAGLVTVACPRGVQPVVAAKLTEALTISLPECVEGSVSSAAVAEIEKPLARADIVAAGPGLGTAPDTIEFVKRLLPAVARPLVLDADALSALAGGIELLTRRSHPTIITPHPGELARMFGSSVEDIQSDRSAWAVRAAKETGAVCVLKGHGTVVSDGGETHINETGNPGMATGGSGDVLTGLIAALLAQGLGPLGASRLGVYLHGLAGDLAARKLGQFSMIAGDIVDYLPDAFRQHQKMRRK